jgi:hypothetical protein
MQNLAVQSFLKIFGDYSIRRKSISQGKPYLPVQEAVQRIAGHCRIKISARSRIDHEIKNFSFSII